MSRERILVTGSAGLIGRAIARLCGASADVIRYDLRHGDESGRHDLHDAASLERAVAGATGIVHLGAVARVAEGEEDPARCWSTNFEATRNLLRFALRSRERPWFVFASSREVYGQQSRFPVPEDAPLSPANTYARSKASGEGLVAQARDEGLRTAVVRFSNVYGDIEDYPDRVIPAFAAAAARGGVLRLDGPENVLDFIHLDDASDGLLRVIATVAAGETMIPTVHLVSGAGTSLAALAAMAIAEGAPGAKMVGAAPRAYAMREFVGDPARAQSLLGWRATVPLRVGLAQLVSAFGRALARTDRPVQEAGFCK